MKFNELNLSEELLRAIEEMGFENPTEVQESSIPVLLEGRDVLAQAQTGTGKTAAFGIPMIEKIQENESRDIQALVLVPTRELAKQVSDELSRLAKFKKFIKILPVYGGADMRRQLKELKKGVNIVVGTPGRVMDHMRRRTIRVRNLKILVLDEADEMFDMGFRDDMKTIIDETNQDRQTCFFSATLGNDIKEFSNLYQENPKEIIIEKKELTASKINQYYLEMSGNMKTEILNRLLNIYNPKKSIVFSNTKRMVEKLESDIAKKGYIVDSLHGDMRQAGRDNVMKKFRTGAIDILVATDIAARGLDIDDVDIVFNYDLPQQNDYYVHRIGRTARAGKEGISFTFVTDRDFHKLPEIEKYTNAKMEKMELPTISDIRKSNTEKLYSIIEKELNSNEDTSSYGDVVNSLLSSGHGLYEIATGLIKIIDDSNTGSEIEELVNVDYGKKFEIKKTRSKSSEKRKKRIDGPKIFINKGKRDGVDFDEIIRTIRKYTKVPVSQVGDINIMPNFSFVEIPENLLRQAIKDLDGKKIKGRVIKAEFSNR